MREFVTIKNTRDLIVGRIDLQRKELSENGETFKALGRMMERNRIMGIIASMLPTEQTDESHLKFLLSIMERITE